MVKHGESLRALGLMTAVALLAGAACSPSNDATDGDWSPAPTTVKGLKTVATADANGFALHTAGGDRTFMTGVNLGSTTPLHQPGEVSTISRDHYKRWIRQMGDMGIRTVRVYTLLPPSFYSELKAHNEANRTDPIYLVQGVYLPDESYLDPTKTLYSKDVDESFAQELRDISAAVHGDFNRPETPGRASGNFTADVSPWLAAWIVGVELDGESVARTDRINSDVAQFQGDYFVSTKSASPTERWLARHMDTLAAAETQRGISVPIAFVNWPTTDPLKHPTEPLANEDLAGVDAMHVLPTKRWPGGTFASFHAYPYYPDFQRYEPGLDKVKWNGRSDRYGGYLASLKKHFAGTMPLLVTEFGVPSSLGSAHAGPLGRDQGDHTEAEAMKINADLLHLMDHLDLGGGFVFAWTDEWFKRTWNTMEHQVADRRQLWHDPLTNEQWFGMIATDPQPLDDASTEETYGSGPVKYVRVWADASWVHIDLSMREEAPNKMTVDADVIPGKDGADYRVRIDGDTATLEVRRDLDPIRLDTADRPYRPDADDEWHTYALITNRAYTEPGKQHPAEFQLAGELKSGVTWKRSTKGINLTLPWSMLGLADPSSRTALGEGEPAEFITIPGIDFTFDIAGVQVGHQFTWATWNYTTYKERPKKNVSVLTDAMRQLAR